MWSVGLLFADLARESEGAFLDRIWPYFIGVTIAFATVVAVIALRRPGGTADRRESRDEDLNR